MHYLVGDLQGCDDAFERLLAVVAFSPSRDRLTVLGDMINRGPSSLAVLRRLRGLGGAAQSLLGNHDLHFLAVAKGVRPAHGSDTLQPLLDDAEREAWVEWVRHRPLALRAEGWLCVHAGLPPQWDGARTLALAAEVEAMLRSGDLEAFLRVMYGNEPARWDESLHGADRWRFVINALTRMRFCTADGTLDFKRRGGAARPLPLVRRAGTAQCRRARRLRPLVDARARRAPGPAGAGHGLRLGPVPQRGASRRGSARDRAGALHPGAAPGLSPVRCRSATIRSAAEAWQSGRLHLT